MREPHRHAMELALCASPEESVPIGQERERGALEAPRNGPNQEWFPMAGNPCQGAVLIVPSGPLLYAMLTKEQSKEGGGLLWKGCFWL